MQDLAYEVVVDTIAMQLRDSTNTTAIQARLDPEVRRTTTHVSHVFIPNKFLFSAAEAPTGAYFEPVSDALIYP